MSATAGHPAGSMSSDHLTLLYTTNPDGWVTAQIAEFPEAISQGEDELTARVNVLEALHDLTHEPTPAEWLAFRFQAVLDDLEGVVGPLAQKARDAIEHAIRAAVGRAHDRTLR